MKTTTRSFKPRFTIKKGDRKTKCVFCRKDAKEIKYSNVSLLLKYVSERCKIKPRYISGNCHKHQDRITKAIARAKELALISYIRG